MDNQPVFNNDPELEAKILLLEEQLMISKKWEETGKVLLSKTVTQEEVPYEMPLLQEEFITERKEINQIVATAPRAVRQEGGRTIVSILKEVLVVEKKLMLVEEIHLSKRQTEFVVSGTETILKEHLSVSRTVTSPTESGH